jgi:hypothetical protein
MIPSNSTPHINDVSNPPFKLLSITTLLVDNIEIVMKFFISVFSSRSHDILEKPVRHCIVELPNDQKIFIVQKSSCNQAQLSYFTQVSVSQIYMSVNSPVNTLALATEAGARISESDIDGAGGNFCIIEGPSGLYFHISNHLKSSKSEDLIFSSSIFDEDRPETRERNDSITPPSPSPKVNRRMQNKRPAPIFRSLDVQILSNFSKNFIPCPPNSREPIQFETELFKGQALLVLRTNPFDPQFTSFFEGRR